eukprot:scaffold630_cov399-Prasinococcus_capsulatus_cf.AAC.40
MAQETGCTSPRGFGTAAPACTGSAGGVHTRCADPRGRRSRGRVQACGAPSPGVGCYRPEPHVTPGSSSSSSSCSSPDGRTAATMPPPSGARAPGSGLRRTAGPERGEEEQIGAPACRERASERASVRACQRRRDVTLGAVRPPPHHPCHACSRSPPPAGAGAGAARASWRPGAATGHTCRRTRGRAALRRRKRYLRACEDPHGPSTGTPAAGPTALLAGGCGPALGPTTAGAVRGPICAPFGPQNGPQRAESGAWPPPPRPPPGRGGKNLRLKRPLIGQTQWASTNGV